MVRGDFERVDLSRPTFPTHDAAPEDAAVRTFERDTLARVRRGAVGGGAPGPGGQVLGAARARAIRDRSGARPQAVRDPTQRALDRAQAEEVQRRRRRRHALPRRASTNRSRPPPRERASAEKHRRRSPTSIRCAPCRLEYHGLVRGHPVRPAPRDIAQVLPAPTLDVVERTAVRGRSRSTGSLARSATTSRLPLPTRARRPWPSALAGAKLSQHLPWEHGGDRRLLLRQSTHRGPAPRPAIARSSPEGPRSPQPEPETPIRKVALVRPTPTPTATPKRASAQAAAAWGRSFAPRN